MAQEVLLVLQGFFLPVLPTDGDLPTVDFCLPLYSSWTLEVADSGAPRSQLTDPAGLIVDLQPRVLHV